MAKQCVTCSNDIPANRARYNTCSTPCADIRKKVAWKENSNGRIDTEQPEVKLKTKWLTKAWRLVA